MASPTEQTKGTLPSLEGILGRFSNIGETLTRVVAGLFLVPHGAQKLFGWFGGYGLEATGQFFQTQMGFSNGFLMALGAGLIEFFGGLALALGLFTRSNAIVLALFLLVASSFHFSSGFFWVNGGFKYPVFWAIVIFGFALKGAGAHSLDQKFGIKF